MIKRRVLLLLIFYVSIGLLGQYAKTKFTDVGIEYARDLSDFDNKIIQIENGMEKKKQYKQHYQKYFDYYVTAWDESECIIIGEATGKYRSDSYSGIQEIVVHKVLKGDREELTDQTIWVADMGGFKWDEKEKLCRYASFNSLMQKENQYLIFMNSYQITSGLYNETNIKMEEFGYENYYSLSGGYFSYLNMDRDTNSLMPERENYVYRYGDIKDYEFFCKEEKILEIRNEIKHEIIKRCLEKYSGEKRN